MTAVMSSENALYLIVSLKFSVSEKKIEIFRKWLITLINLFSPPRNFSVFDGGYFLSCFLRGDETCFNCSC